MEKLVSLSELAKKVKVNKSKLSYYVSFGLIRPIDRVGGTMVFEMETALATINKIKELQNKKYTLKQIKEKTT